MTNTPNLSLPQWAAGQDQPWTSVNEALQLIDASVQLSVISNALSTPPGSPSEGDRYIVAATASGAWVGWEDSIALWVGGVWARLEPVAGWKAWVNSESALFVFDGGWTAFFGGRVNSIVAGANVTVDASDPNNPVVASTGGGGGGGGAVYGAEYMHVREQQPPLTASGTFTAGFHIRTLNTIKTNTISGASLVGNLVTLPAGTYFVIGTAGAHQCNRTSLYLRNNTVGTRIIEGPPIIAGTGADATLQTHVQGKIISFAGGDLCLEQHFETGTGPKGGGIDRKVAGIDEVYAEFFIWKIS